MGFVLSVLRFKALVNVDGSNSLVLRKYFYIGSVRLIVFINRSV